MPTVVVYDVDYEGYEVSEFRVSDVEVWGIV